MNGILAFILILLSTACTTNQPPLNTVDVTDEREVSPETNKGFDLSLQIDAPKSDSDAYTLVANIEIDSGSYIVSPFSKDEFYLPYSLSIPTNVHLMPEGEVLEIPPSVVEFDTIIERQVRFVRTNTVYKHQLKVHNQNDFKVKGLIELLIEPQCIPYDIEFELTQTAGELEVNKMKTFISKEYKL